MLLIAKRTAIGAALLLVMPVIVWPRLAVAAGSSTGHVENVVLGD